MFDLIKAKYELKEAVEMQAHDETLPTDNIRVVHARQEPNYAVCFLNLVLFIASVSLVVYGSVHFDECPKQIMIAVSFIVIGVLFCLSRILNARHEFLEAMNKSNVPPKPACLVWITLILQIIVLGWFFALSYWVYSIKPYINETDRHSPDYCEENFYKNAFWGATFALVAIGVTLILTCVVLCYLKKKRIGNN